MTCSALRSRGFPLCRGRLAQRHNKRNEACYCPPMCAPDLAGTFLQTALVIQVLVRCRAPALALPSLSMAAARALPRTRTTIVRPSLAPNRAGQPRPRDGTHLARRRSARAVMGLHPDFCVGTCRRCLSVHAQLLLGAVRTNLSSIPNLGGPRLQSHVGALSCENNHE